MRTVATSKTLDPEATRRAILASAEMLFSDLGFAATSLQDIADCAGVTKSLVAYHFGNKENLWHTTLTGLMEAQMSGLLDEIESGRSLTLGDLVRFRFRAFQANPRLNRLLAWMSLEPSLGGVRPPTLLPRLHAVLDGVTNRISPAEVLGMMTAIDGWFRFRHIYEAFLPEIEDPTALDEEVIENLLKSVPAQIEVLK